VNGSHTVQLFADLVYEIDATATNGAVIDPEGSNTVMSGTSMTFRFSAEKGYIIMYILVNGERIDIRDMNGTYTFSNVNGDCTIHVVAWIMITPDVDPDKVTSDPEYHLVDPDAPDSEYIFVFTPKEGYTVDHIIVNGERKECDGTYVFKGSDGPQTIEVVTIPVFKVDMPSDTADYELSKNGTFKVKEGHTFSFEVDNITGKMLKISAHVTGDAGTSIDVTYDPILNAYVIGPVFADITVTVEALGYTVTLPDSTHDYSITSSGEFIVKEGEPLVFTIVPNAGKTVRTELRNADGSLFYGHSVSDGVYTIRAEDMDQNVIVTVRLYTVTVTVPSSVAGDYEVEDGKEGSNTVGIGTEFAFLVTPEPGKILEVTITGGGKLTKSGNAYFISELTDNVTVSIKVSKVIVKVPTDPNGQYTTDPAGGEFEVEYGDSFKFTVKPQDGSRADVYINGKLLSPSWVDEDGTAHYELPNMKESAEIDIAVISTKYTVVVASSNGVDISPSGTNVYFVGTDAKFTMKAKTGYVLKDVIVDGVSMGAISSYVFADVEGGVHTLSVVYDVDWAIWFVIGGVCIIVAIGSLIAWALYRRRSEEEETEASY